MVRENIKKNDQELDKELAEKMINSFFFDEYLKNRSKVYLESHNINHAISVLNIVPNFPDIGIETRYINQILTEMATIYARLLNQYEIRYHIIFSASFYKINEEDQRSDETEIFTNSNTNRNLTENDINDIDIKSQLEHQIQIQETKESGWIFDKFNSMKIRFCKTGEINGSSYVKVPLRSTAILDIQKNDKYCFLWTILASLHPCDNIHPTRVKISINILVN